MKTSPFFCRALVFIFLLSCLDLSATNKISSVADSLPNYVVIGAFSKQRNAVKFANHANQKLNLSAKFEINPNRNLFYVYCLITPDKEAAITEAKRLRSETELIDAWVYHGLLGKQLANTRNADINPVTKEPMVVVASETAEKKQDGKVESTVAEQPIKEQTTTSTIHTPDNSFTASADEVGMGKSFLFKLSRFVDQQAVEGSVNVIDADKLKKIGTYQSNKPVRVSEPENKSGTVILETDLFGYRKQQRQINFFEPGKDTTDIVRDEAGNIVVPFELIRLKKGDFAIMYNVFFFRDAAIMRPESRFEVSSLLEMLKENPKYTIRIHGHTNGNHAGKIIYKDEKGADFFTLNGSKDGYGSAKELSRARAEVIRDFLISEGIAPERSSIKAWGGKKSIYDKHSAKAQDNVRVEIEILEDK